MAERASQPTLADAGRTEEREIIVGVDPFAFGELLEQGAVESPWIAVIDILDAGLLPQFGDAQPRRQALVLSP